MHTIKVLIITMCLGFTSSLWAQTFDVTTYQISGNSPIGINQSNAVLAPLTGKNLSVEDIQNAAKVLTAEFKARGFGFHRAIVPEQSIDYGIVKIKVVSFSLAKVEVKGNEIFSDENILRSLPLLREGWVPNSNALARNITIANSHPAKLLSLNVRKSETPDAIDAVVTVQDRSATQMFLNLTNTGSEDTGEERLTAGLQYANLFNLDHSVTLTYTTSPGHWDDVEQYGFNYNIPLYEQGLVASFFYSQSDVDSGIIADVLEVTGSGKFSGVRLNKHLLRTGNYNHNLILGFDDKLFESVVDEIFFGTSALTGDGKVRSRPWSLAYTGGWTFERANISFNLSYQQNLGSGSKNTKANYSNSRDGTHKYWRSLKYNFNADYLTDKNWLLRFAYDGQYSSQALISGEQFGAGGAGSVRGFLPREISGDLGNHVIVEAWTPPLMENLQTIFFVDWANAWNRKVLEGDESGEEISSVGISLKWRPLENLHIDVDWGYILDGATDTETNDNAYHFSVFYSI